MVLLSLKSIIVRNQHPLAIVCAMCEWQCISNKILRKEVNKYDK